MPVDEKQFTERMAKAQAERAGNGKAGPATVTPPSANLDEYLSGHDDYDKLVRHMGPFIQTVQNEQTDAKQQAIQAVQEPIVRSFQIKWWMHYGIEQGVREVLKQIKQFEVDRKLTL